MLHTYVTFSFFSNDQNLGYACVCITCLFTLSAWFELSSTKNKNAKENVCVRERKINMEKKDFPFWKMINQNLNQKKKMENQIKIKRG